METITVNGVEYTRIDESQDVRIAVLQRGNILVGRFTRDGDMCTLHKASVVRRWGTTKGLGEIAIDGPTEKTVLDYAGRVEFHILTAVMLIECAASAWEDEL